MQYFLRKARPKAWKKFVTILIWWSIGAHPSPCSTPSIPTGPVMLVNICFKAIFHPPARFALEIFQLIYILLHIIHVEALCCNFLLNLCFKALKRLLEWFEICSASSTPIIDRYLRGLIWNSSPKFFKLSAIETFDEFDSCYSRLLGVGYISFPGRIHDLFPTRQHFFQNYLFERPSAALAWVRILLYRICFITFMVPFQTCPTWDGFRASSVLSSSEFYFF